MREEAITQAKILIADDEPSVIRVLERALRSARYRRHLGVTDPRQVSALLETFQPDLVVLDLWMPHMDGFAVMRSIKERIRPGDYLPILVITGDQSREAKERALSLGAKDFVSSACGCAASPDMMVTGPFRVP